MKFYVDFGIKIDKKMYFMIYILLFHLLIFMDLILYYYPYGNMDKEKIIELSSFILIFISLTFVLAISPKYLKKNHTLLVLIIFFGIFPIIILTQYRSNMNEIFIFPLEGVVKEKYISKNHSYHSIKIETKSGVIIKREGIGENLWNNIKVGDLILKRKYSFDILINGRKFSMIDRNIKIIPSIQRKNIKNP